MPPDKRSLSWSMKMIDGTLYGGGFSSLSSTGGRVTRKTGSGMTGKPFWPDDRLKELHFENDNEKAGRLKLVFYNEDLAYFNTPLLVKGTNFDIAWGYSGFLSDRRSVKVIGIKGFTTITVEADVVENSFSHVEKTVVHPETKLQALAERIAKENRFAKTDIRIPTGILGPFAQIAESDRLFLLRLGRPYGLRLFTKVEQRVLVLHYHQTDLFPPPTATLTWRGGQGILKAFDIVENSLLGEPTSSQVGGYDSENRKVTNGLATGAQKKATLGSSSEFNQPENLVETEFGTVIAVSANKGAAKFPKSSELLPRVHETDVECQAEADARYDETQEHQILASAEIVGDPTIEVDSIIRIEGLPQMLAGNYKITKVNHEITSSGYTTKVKLIRDAASSLPGDPTQPIGSKGRLNNQRQGDRGALDSTNAVETEFGTIVKVFKQKR